MHAAILTTPLLAQLALVLHDDEILTSSEAHSVEMDSTAAAAAARVAIEYVGRVKQHFWLRHSSHLGPLGRTLQTPGYATH